MGGRVKRRAGLAAAAALARDDAPPACALCGRPLGQVVEWHHAVPRSQGGRATVPVHPICHRAIHATFTNAELAASGGDLSVLRPGLAPYLRWIAGKPADFHAPTRRPR